VGLLTKIFGNREDGEPVADEGAEQSVESSEMLEPDDKMESQPSEVSADASASESDAAALPESPVQRPETTHSAPRSQPPRARAARRNGGAQEPRDPSTGRYSRPSAQRLDAASKRQSTPESSVVRNLQPGGKLTDPTAGSPFARGTTRTPPVKAAGVEAAHSAATPSKSAARDQADDSEEIDVSDQLEALDVDAADDLDASDDLIIDEDEDEETNTSFSAWGVVGASGETAASASGDQTFGRWPGTAVPAEQVNEQRNRGPSETSRPIPDRSRMPHDMNAPKQTLVEAGTEFKGTLKSSCPVAVNGTIDGDIDAPTLNIASSGSILGNVKAKTLRSQGTLSGNVDAEEVFLSGAVRSKTFIKTRRLEMKLGSMEKSQLEVTFGNCDIDPSDAS
jgi:cytoskeletal protein CcmA (bactofilin family)